MAEYISREALQNAVERNCDMQDLYLPIHFLQIADEIPAADVREVRHGKWLKYDDTEYFIAKCSLCRNWIDTRHGTNYCPNCGARMDGDADV